MADRSRPPVEFVVSPDGNAFMVDIAGWLAEAASLAGYDARVVADGSLPGDHPGVRSFAVAPHELYELSDRSDRDRRAAATRSIPVATEQPGTPWFERSLEWCCFAPWTLDINASAVEAGLAAGLDVRHLQLGAVPSMDRRDEAEREAGRSVDVAVLAGLTDHRAGRLAALASTLWRRRSRLLLFPTDRPVTDSRYTPTAPGAGPLFGDDKYRLLADTRVLLNLHRDGVTTYFEWARIVEAMANGCAVVTEPSDSIEPLIDGMHLVVTESPEHVLNELLDDEERCASIGRAAAEVVHGELALDRTMAVHLEAAIETLDLLDLKSSASTPRSAPAGQPPARPPRPAFRPHRELRERLLDAIVAERRLRREIDALRCATHHRDAEYVEVVDSASWAAASADVSAIVTVFDYADVVTDALDSLAASTGVGVEIVVVDDHSRDAGIDVVAAWIDRHPEVPARLVARQANRGLAAARDLAIEHTRTDHVMVLDADNQVYPTCLARLSDALRADRDAAFAWSILEVFGGSAGLMSAYGWLPDRLVERNHIDAQVMLRRSVWQELGGYRELDGLLPGWEDWDLWLRLVETGRHGSFVPEVLGRYRSQPGSMVSGPNRFTDVMLERFEAAHPTLVFPPR